MSELRCIAIDDEPVALKVIERHCSQVPFLNLIGTFRSPVEALDWLLKNEVDFIFLDINMPGLSGYDLIGALKKVPYVIITTAYSDFAVKSYEFNVVDYLLKPIEFQRIVQAVTKVQGLIERPNSTSPEQKSDESRYFKNGGQVFRIRLQDLLYVESSGNLLTLFMKERKLTLRLTMKQLMAELPTNDFIRIHKSYIVAANAVDLFENHQVHILGKRIPVGITYRSAYLQFLSNKV